MSIFCLLINIFLSTFRKMSTRSRQVKKPKYVLLQFDIDDSTLVKETQYVRWKDQTQTRGKAVVEGKLYSGRALYFNGKHNL